MESMIRGNLGREQTGQALREAVLQGIIRQEDTSAIFYDLDYLESRIRHLVACFPSDTLHGLAIKANPLAEIMKFARDIAPGIGVEAASPGEVAMALKAGYPASRVVFDSPVKTMEDLSFALGKGVRLNIDNFAELGRVGEILSTLTGSGTLTGSIGLRINPQVGTGTIAESSVAGIYSKFGIPINYFRRELEQAYLNCPWLTGIHLHVGSQGCPVEMLINGIGILYDFVLDINVKRASAGMTPVSVFDIGGGLPISYRSDTLPPSMEEYVKQIKQRAPALFDGKSFKLITEFGRWVYTNAGWTVSRVEYVKREPTLNTAMLHIGADLFVRECLNPKDWQHEYSVFDRNGFLKTGVDPLPYNLAGPLCFSGDIIAKNVALPRIEEGDFLVIHDTGGYTFSMWSRYNSRQTPRIVGYRDNTFRVLKERETMEGLAGFWE
jgi:diaminopimelate decarboxylase